MSVADITMLRSVARWEPGAADRLRTAALDLFVQQGYDATTTAEIAARAGVTERTFFRHFDDKREVLFTGTEQFSEAFVGGVAAAPAGAAPLEAVASALTAVATFFPEERRAHARRRWSVIGSHPALRERELLKLAALSQGLAAAFRERGVADPAATLAAESAMTVFRVAFDRWLADDETRPLPALQDDVLAALTALTATGGSPDATGGRAGLPRP